MSVHEKLIRIFMVTVTRRAATAVNGELTWRYWQIGQRLKNACCEGIGRADRCRAGAAAHGRIWARLEQAACDTVCAWLRLFPMSRFSPHCGEN
jgi:hypothetical protein